jgi:colanic acid/amylovoran biosynthesis protein
MHILIDQAAQDMRNKGNNALLEAAMYRLLELWPRATIDVVTLAPTLTKLYYPRVRPIRPGDLQPFQSRFHRIFPIIPRWIWLVLFEIREAIWHRWPGLMTSKLRLMVRSWLPKRVQPTSSDQVPYTELDKAETEGEQACFRQAMTSYDLVVASGGGYLCDADKSLLLSLFERLEAAIKSGVSTVMVGQGVGPLEDPELRARAREILPRTSLIFVREQRVALPLLNSLAVPPERIKMTGDDAILMAYEARLASLGTGIGVSLRVAHYTAVGTSHIATIRAILQQKAHQYQAPLIAAPISSAPHETDITFIRQLLAGYDDVSISWRKLDTPLDAIHRIARCRMMITGTFHGAIFALAQGIPVVAVAKSLEYLNKFSGLADEFGPGCQVIRLDADQLVEQLSSAIDQAWALADEFRPALLGAARRQVQQQHAAYQQIYEQITSYHSYSYR